MICYRDRAFCSDADICQNNDACGRWFSTVNSATNWQQASNASQNSWPTMPGCERRLNWQRRITKRNVTALLFIFALLAVARLVWGILK